MHLAHRNAINAIWIMLGMLSPIAAYIAYPGRIPEQSFLIFGALLVISVWGVNSYLSFSFGPGGLIDLSPCASALALGIVVLPPVLAVSLGLAFLVDIEQLRTAGRQLRVFESAGKLMPGLFVGTITAQSAAELHMTAGPQLILAGICVVTVLGIVDLTSFTVTSWLFESSPREAVGMYGPVVLAEGFVSLVAVALAGPFQATPPIMLMVLVSFQILALAAARISTSESLNRSKTKYLHDTLKRYVPASIADELAQTGQDLQLGGETTEISVLFCDIRGFTTWSETVSAHEVIDQLNVLLRELSASVMQFGGTLDKFTGDGLMAFWGAPLARPDHADLAVSAALDMMVRLDRTNATRKKQGYDPFIIGIGIHSGTAVVGNVGHEERLEYTAIGDTVNTAARLESATKDLATTLLFSESTQSELLPTRQRMSRDYGHITVKGKAEPLTVYGMPESSSIELVSMWDAALMTPDDRAA